MALREEPGDATHVRDQTIIAHVCNDIGKWGAGFTRAIDLRWPEVRCAYVAWEGGATPTLRALGQVQFIRTQRQDVIVANMIAQHGVRGRSNPVPLNNSALRTCLLTVLQVATAQGYRVVMPRVGCGLAGGQWEGPGGVFGIVQAASSVYPNVDITVRTG